VHVTRVKIAMASQREDRSKTGGSGRGGCPGVCPGRDCRSRKSNPKERSQRATLCMLLSGSYKAVVVDMDDAGGGGCPGVCPRRVVCEHNTACTKERYEIHKWLNHFGSSVTHGVSTIFHASKRLCQTLAVIVTHVLCGAIVEQWRQNIMCV
jgi:hypothetical protein